MKKSRPQKKTSTAAAPVPACAGASSKPGAAGGLDLSSIAHQFGILAREMTEALKQAQTLEQRRLEDIGYLKIEEARKGDRPAVKVIMETDTPALRGPMGLSVHRGVLVWWDEDRDGRVLDVINAMPAYTVDRLLAVHEREGGIDLVWDGPIPAGYEEGSRVIAECDCWFINSSIGLLEDRILPFEKAVL